jgi:hypothetical protein
LSRDPAPEGTQQTLKEIRATLKIVNFITKARVGEVSMQIIEDAELMKNLFIMLHQVHSDQSLVNEVLVDLIALFENLACIPSAIEVYLRPFQNS